MKSRLYIARFFAIIVAIQVLNMSIYNGDFVSIISAGTSSSGMDETDSFVEFIIENIEHKNIDTDTETHNNSKESHTHKDFQVKYFIPTVSVIHIHRPLNCSELTNEFIISYNYLFCKEINPPPPKAIA